MRNRRKLDHTCLNCNNELYYRSDRSVKYCSKKCSNSHRRPKKKREFSSSYISPNKGKKRPDMTGENNWNWKGGVTTQNEKIRKSNEYKTWRDSVFTRDRWSCVHCGRMRKKGDRVIVHADHIKPFALFPSLSFDVNNGRNLCVECHKKTETWGMNQWTKEKINVEYLADSIRVFNRIWN